MTLAADKRARLHALKAEIAAIMDPVQQERRAKAKAARKASRQAAQQSTLERRREPRETDPGFLAYLRRQPCAAREMGGCDGPIEAAHIRYADAASGARGPGMQRKAHDRHANPLCRHHHQHDQHKGAERLFWDRVGVDAYECAARHYATYRGERS